METLRGGQMRSGKLKTAVDPRQQKVQSLVIEIPYGDFSRGYQRDYIQIIFFFTLLIEPQNLWEFPI